MFVYQSTWHSARNEYIRYFAKWYSFNRCGSRFQQYGVWSTNTPFFQPWQGHPKKKCICGKMTKANLWKSNSVPLRTDEYARSSSLIQYSGIESNNWTHLQLGIATGISSLLLTSDRWKVTVNFMNSLSFHANTLIPSLYIPELSEKLKKAFQMIWYTSVFQAW